MKYKSSLAKTCGMFKRCLGLVLVLAMMITLIPTAPAKAEGEKEATTKIYFHDNRNWGAPKIWAWREENGVSIENYTGGDWDNRPPMQSKGGDWYVYEISTPVESEFCLNVTNPKDTDRVEWKNINTNEKSVTGFEQSGQYGFVVISDSATEVQSPIINGNQVNFKYYAPKVSSVCVKGSFNNDWTIENPMQSDGNGWWTLKSPLILENGTYVYKFFVNGNDWENDPLNNNVLVGETKNNTFTVEAGDYLGTSFNPEVEYVPTTIISENNNGVLIAEVANVQNYYSTDNYPTTTKNYIYNNYNEPHGYIFAGWYKDEAGSIPYETFPTGTAYAKFVDANVLTIKVQRGGTGTDKANLRFLTSVDSLSYREIGFEIYCGQRLFTNNSKRVYKTVLETKGGTAVAANPDTVFENSNSIWFAAFSITGIPSTAWNDAFRAKAHWITMDGTRVTGIERDSILINTLLSAGEPVAAKENE